MRCVVRSSVATREIARDLSARVEKTYACVWSYLVCDVAYIVVVVVVVRRRMSRFDYPEALQGIVGEGGGLSCALYTIHASMQETT